MNTLKLTDSQLELVRRELLGASVADMEFACEQLDRLATVAPWPPTSMQSTDAQSAIKLVREGLDAIDALGWPLDDVAAADRNVTA